MISKSAKKHTTFNKNRATFNKKHPLFAKIYKNAVFAPISPDFSPFPTNPRNALLFHITPLLSIAYRLFPRPPPPPSADSYIYN
jgi:hypothetical protein